MSSSNFSPSLLLHSKFLRTFLVCLILLVIPACYFLVPSPPSPDVYDDLTTDSFASGSVDLESHRWVLSGSKVSGKESAGVGSGDRLDNAIIKGGVVMGHLGNETAKAELGRASWKLLHLMTLRFPEKPTADERSALRSYFYLFSRLYPCGECATHFQALLKEYPPQTSSRKSASLWLCSLHNMVNARLLKPAFDCETLDETYDCGCAEEDGQLKSSGQESGKDTVTGIEMIKGG
ncbi:Mitochondrial sulfhydryl oxidase involved in the biogenesis of cytosolic Fe/S proteins [Phaffia rhodozyma]|uniref:Sulfhydryl oxidase n=1 Tax=Phaffia rhodozyma TaxID=264483 RepID=A0A0F7SK88_PHARH|nr:Mitochondrial sulfhydryl oxidase involved in the biogenesis of cytosolic Fe/S proteins [Phaffia rhodozyma]